VEHEGGGVNTRQYTQDGLTVPYIALWTGETDNSPRPIVRRMGDGPRIAYADETLYDRDQYGVLWVRQALAQGKGRAKFPSINAMRQRRVFSQLLCQVCAKSTLSKDSDRQLYLRKSTGRPIAEGETTHAPPVCAPCAPEAARDCPHLRRGYVAAWVEYSPTWGVAGVIYDPRTLQPVREGDDGEGLTAVSHTNPDIRWTIAYRQMVSLHGVTPVDLAEFAA
jgi:hypothetical protein